MHVGQHALSSDTQPSVQNYNYEFNTEFVAAVGMLRKPKIAIQKLEQFQN